MNEQSILNGLKNVLIMEWYGIRAEDTKEIKNQTGAEVVVSEDIETALSGANKIIEQYARKTQEI